MLGYGYVIFGQQAVRPGPLQAKGLGPLRIHASQGVSHGQSDRGGQAHLRPACSELWQDEAEHGHLLGRRLPQPVKELLAKAHAKP